MPFFGPLSCWNRKASEFKKHPDSANIVKELVRTSIIACPNINISNFSFPVYKVPNSVPKVPVRLVKRTKTATGYTYADVPTWDKPNTRKLLAAGVRLKTTMKPAAGSDGHLIVANTDESSAVGLWRAQYIGGKWQCEGAGFVDDYVNGTGIVKQFSTGEWVGERATGLSGLGGLITRAEVQAGVIPHGLAIALLGPKKGWPVKPAIQSDGGSLAAYAPREGQRLRLPSGYSSTTTIPLLKMIERAASDYSLIVTDKAGCHAFFCEDPMTAGGDYKAWQGGKYAYQIGAAFPWAKLEAVQ